MTGRARILATFRFQETDRPGVDLMEGHVWAALMEFFSHRFGFTDTEQVVEFLDPDSRWVGLEWAGPPAPEGTPAAEIPSALSKDVRTGPLAGAATVRDVEAFPRGDPKWLVPRDYAQARLRWPEKALVLCPGWAPMFWGACEAFGLEEALVKARLEPALFEAFIQGAHEFYMDFLSRAAKAARGYCDICWLGDDYAGQKSMLISPELWRRFIKPRLAAQVQAARENGMDVLLHSCGAVRPILADLIDIGVSALLVFQTTAEGMDPESIARDFGGRMVFYGGMDVQRLLSFGTRADVAREVRRNADAFATCGGYVVANSHHGVTTINGDNVIAMFEETKALGGTGGRP